MDHSLLKYSSSDRRWVWDLEKIGSEDVTENVLFLLHTKMSGIPEIIQTVLKVAACIGKNINETMIGYLMMATLQYPGFQEGLDRAVSEGFMEKNGLDYKFVHDEVRKAVYSLLSEDERDQFHHKLGMALYSVAKGKDLGDEIFTIVDQINHGLNSLMQNPALCIDIAELNFKAASKAMHYSSSVIAGSYLNAALSLLPKGHWRSHYNLTLRLKFLSAKAAYSCGCIEKAYGALQNIVDKGHCLEDKLDSYLLLVSILHSQEKAEAYTTCNDVLLKLGEKIPEFFDSKGATEMVKKTSKLLENLSEEDLLGLKVMDSDLRRTLQFYGMMNIVSFFRRPEIVPFLCCRMVQLSIIHGLCKNSILGFIQYAAMLCQSKAAKDIQLACKIGKTAIHLLKRFDSSKELISTLFFLYYGFVAIHMEPIQSCADMLRRGFDIGMSSGETLSAFFNSNHFIRLSLIGGINLPDLIR